MICALDGCGSMNSMVSCIYILSFSCSLSHILSAARCVVVALTPHPPCPDPVGCVSLSRDGQCVLVSRLDSSVVLMDKGEGTLLNTCDK